jgi:hypothetical protein
VAQLAQKAGFRVRRSSIVTCRGVCRRWNTARLAHGSGSRLATPLNAVLKVLAEPQPTLGDPGDPKVVAAEQILLTAGASRPSAGANQART